MVHLVYCVSFVVTLNGSFLVPVIAAVARQQLPNPLSLHLVFPPLFAQLMCEGHSSFPPLSSPLPF